MPRGRTTFIAVAAVGAAILGLAGASAASGPGATPPRGGIFRVAFGPPEQLDTMDPAKANTQASWALLDLTCARLMTYPDAPPPRAFRLVPEVAVAPPKISRGGKTYTFTLKRTFRFSDDLTVTSPQEVLARIEAGRADWGIIPPPLYFAAERGLIRKYGINKTQ